MIKIKKTIKLFIGGDFPRTESGRSFPVRYFDSDKIYAELCLASRKDLRTAVEVAKKVQKSWASKSAYNRGQILYRMGEMMEGRRPDLVELFKDTLGYSTDASQKQIDAAIDAFVYYAGFSDKYQQVLGAVNPVNGPHHNFTTPEATGVLALLDTDEFDFGNLVAQICAIICSGNALVVLLGKSCPAVLAPLAEIFATSDLPGGVVNLLTGDSKELLSVMASHMEIQAICNMNNDSVATAVLKNLGADNMKRISAPGARALSLENILAHVELKTVWHPIGY